MPKFTIIKQKKRIFIFFQKKFFFFVIEIKSFRNKILEIVLPFLFAFGIAYAIHPFLKKIEEKTGATGLKAYKDLTAPYVVNYDMGTYERIEELKFR